MKDGSKNIIILNFTLTVIIYDIIVIVILLYYLKHSYSKYEPLWWLNNFYI